MDIGEFKERTIKHLKSGNATDKHWQEMAECVLYCSEMGFDELITPHCFPIEITQLIDKGIKENK